MSGERRGAGRAGVLAGPSRVGLRGKEREEWAGAGLIWAGFWLGFGLSGFLGFVLGFSFLFLNFSPTKSNKV